MCGLATALTIRRVIASASILSLECTEATTTSRRPSSSSSWSSEPSSRMSTSMPVSSRNGASVSLTSATRSSWSPQPLGRQAVGHRQPRRVVGEHDVLVAQVAGGPGHLLDRAAAVGPVGVACAGRRAAARAAPPRRRSTGPSAAASRVARYSGTAPSQRPAPPPAAVLGPDALELGQRARPGPLVDLVGRQGGQRVGRAAGRPSPGRSPRGRAPAGRRSGAGRPRGRLGPRHDRRRPAPRRRTALTRVVALGQLG